MHTQLLGNNIRHNIFCTLILIFCTILSSASHAQYNQTQEKIYNFQFSADGNKLTAHTGADLTLTIIEAYRKIDDWAIPNDSLIVNILMSVPRLMASSFATVFQHEVFGHGARAREFGWQVTGYELGFFEGATNFITPNKVHKQYISAVGIAGMQASEVLSNKIKDRFTEKKSINPVYGAAYFMSSIDQIEYTLATKYDGNGHDVKGYINDMNNLYGKNYLTKSKVKRNAALGLADPFLYYSLYALFSGQDFEYPMINFGEYRYLPGFRGVFTPYGLEKKFINYIETPSRFYTLSFSHGKHKAGTSMKGELSMNKLYSSDKANIGLNLALWKQPKLFHKDVAKAKNKIGGLATAKLDFKTGENHSVYTEVGYKSPGFVLGHHLKASALVRFGIDLEF